MSRVDLRDLVMSGVRWEITEMSTMNLAAARAASAAAVANTTATQSGRVATFVVPPISPVQSVSVDTARAAAARPADIAALLRMIAEFGHPLRTSVTNVVLPHVAPRPNGLVIVTDMPGMDDDTSGNILTGAAGELLDKMLAAIEMSRENVSIMPMLFWRTPGGRAPTAAEIELSRPFVDRVLEMLRPRIILTFGTMPAAELAGVELAKSHGAHTDGPNGATIITVYHPNYLLLKPAAKRDVWDSLQQVRNLLKSA